MADDRALEDPAAAIKRLTSDLADLQSTVLARLARRPTGDVEICLAPTPKAGTLLLQGQTLNRADYPELWAWAQDRSAVAAGLFGAGDGTTTFMLPDMQGKVLLGAGTLGSDTYAAGDVGGAAARTLALTNMPSHSHPLTGGTGTAASAGDHGGHFDGDQHNAAAGPDYGLAAWNSVGSTRGAHTHSVAVSVFSTAVGGGLPFDNRMAYLAINYAVWV